MSNLDEKLLKVIDEETQKLASTFDSIDNQITNTAKRLNIHNSKARDLTSRLVGSRNDEDKAMLASDEAVSHAIKDRKYAELKKLEKLSKKPYFARIVVEEEKKDDIVELEYKIGFETNLECRIIDWRQAPLSRLYYQYKEGEEYYEEIQGRERVGTIALRHRIDSKDRELIKIGGSFGELSKNRNNPDNDGWVLSSKASRGGNSYSQLPDVLSLITPEQFQAITKDSKTAVLIQGIAGSGKTTVALHRLSWLLEPTNRGLEPQKAAIVVLSPALKTYIKNSLPSIHAEEVPVYDYKEWASLAVTGSTIPLPGTYEECPMTIQRVTLSEAVLKLFEIEATKFSEKQKINFSDNNQIIESYYNILTSVLNNSNFIVENDTSNLIDKDSINRAISRVRKKQEELFLDDVDYPLLVRLKQINAGKIELTDINSDVYDHLVVDEVQDLSTSHITSLINSVNKVSDLTLVGDTGQNLSESSVFMGWEKLISSTGLNDENSNFLTLEVSFRSTAQIMKLGDFVLGEKRTKGGRDGRKPIWFHATEEESVVGGAIDWLFKAMERYPDSLTAVLCRTKKEAKEIYGMLEPRFGATVRLGDTHNFSLEEGILVTEITQVKGLEFTNALLWNVNYNNYRADRQVDRNLLYVAITRAEENLSLFSYGKSSRLIPRGRKELIRQVNLDPEPEENEKDEFSKYELRVR